MGLRVPTFIQCGYLIKVWQYCLNRICFLSVASFLYFSQQFSWLWLSLLINCYISNQTLLEIVKILLKPCCYNYSSVHVLMRIMSAMSHTHTLILPSLVHPWAISCSVWLICEHAGESCSMHTSRMTNTTQQLWVGVLHTKVSSHWHASNGRLELNSEFYISVQFLTLKWGSKHDSEL